MRRILNLLFAFGQIAASIYVSTAGTDEFSKQEPGGDPPIIPAGYAFSIWSVIFLGCVLYAIYQLLPSQKDRPLFKEIGWYTGLAMVGTTSWLFVAQSETRAWWTVAILAATTILLALAQRGVAREAPFNSRIDEIIVRGTLSVFFGWCSIAVFANLAAAMRNTGMTAPGAEATITFVLIAAATVFASLVLAALRGNVWYAATLVWAFVAIALANFNGWRREPNPAVAYAAIGAIVVVVLVYLLTRRVSALPSSAT